VKGLYRRLIGVLAGSFLLTGCEPAPVPKPQTVWPEGTALVVGDVPILRSEIEATADSLALVNPVHTRPALRREALLAQLLPRAAVHLEAGTRTEEVRQEALDALAILKGEAEGTAPEVFVTSGYPTAIGFDRWSAARQLDLNLWSGPFEGVGNWFLVRVLERFFEPGEKRSALQKFEIEWVSFDFLPTDWDGGQFEAVLERVGVLGLQPEWTELIPYSYRRTEQK
jgi:hypothetical protein